MSELPEDPWTAYRGREQRELTEALTAAMMATEAYRRWTAHGAEGGSDAEASLKLVIEEADRMGDAAKRLLSIHTQTPA